MNYKTCNDGCKWWRLMVDMNDSTYTVKFCDFEMCSILEGTMCAYYTKKVKDDEEESIDYN